MLFFLFFSEEVRVATQTFKPTENVHTARGSGWIWPTHPDATGDDSAENNQWFLSAAPSSPM